MISYKEILENLVLQVEYTTGQLPNWKNPYHRSVLFELLLASELSEVSNEIMKNLMEVGETPRTSKEVDRENSVDDKYVGVGNNYFVRKTDYIEDAPDGKQKYKDGAQKFTKTDSGQYKPIQSTETPAEEPSNVLKASEPQTTPDGSDSEQEQPPELGTSMMADDYQKEIKQQEEAAKNDQYPHH